MPGSAGGASTGNPGDIYTLSLANGSIQTFIAPTNVSVNGSNVLVTYGAAPPISVSNVLTVKHTLATPRSVRSVQDGSSGCVGGEEFNWETVATDFTGTNLTSQDLAGYTLTYVVPAADYNKALTQSVLLSYDYFPPTGGEDVYTDVDGGTFEGTWPYNTAYTDSFGISFGGTVGSPYDNVVVTINGTTPSGGSTDWTAEGNQRGCRLPN